MLQSSTTKTGVALNLSAAKNWLMRGAPVLEDGGVLSWLDASPDEAHPGYRYSEIAGLFLAFLDSQDSDPQLAARVRAALHRDIAPHGAAGRNGFLYVFDSAIVYSAIPSQPLLDFIKRGVETRTPVTPGHAGSWSTEYGSHLLKVAAILADAGCMSHATQLWNDLRPLEDSGCFRNHAATNSTYLHAHCYAVQGLLSLAEYGFEGARGITESAGEWLAGVQRQDGGIPAWHDGVTSHGPSRGDATAQAARIWRELDAIAYAREIAQAQEFLATLQHPSGGLCYEPGSDDVNTWVTIFGVEAFEAS